MLLMGLLAAVSVPRLNRSVRARETAMAVSDFEAWIKAGRREAVRRGLKVQLSYDPKKNDYGLSLQAAEHSNREEYEPFRDDFWDARRALPQGMTLEGLGRANALIFEPTGAAEECELRLTNALGERKEIKVGEWYEETPETAPR
jgi:type II secretory pathway pseudopilin PulG